MNRGKSVPGMKLDLPDKSLRPNRRSAGANRGNVPHGTNFVQDFRDGGSGATSASHVTSPTSKGKRVTPVPAIQPGYNTALNPEKAGRKLPRE